LHGSASSAAPPSTFVNEKLEDWLDSDDLICCGFVQEAVNESMECKPSASASTLRGVSPNSILDGLGQMFVRPITYMNDGIPPPIGGSLKKFASPSEENTTIIANINEIRAWLYYHISVLEMVHHDIAGAKPFYDLVHEIDLMLTHASRHATFDIIGNLLTKTAPTVDCHVAFAEETTIIANETTTDDDGDITMEFLSIPVGGVSMENLELLDEDDEDDNDMDASVKSADDDDSLKLWMGNLDLDEYLETVSSEYQDRPEIRRYMGNRTGNVHSLSDESPDRRVRFRLCDDDNQEVEVTYDMDVDEFNMANNGIVNRRALENRISYPDDDDVSTTTRRFYPRKP
jgi:hypothetical protein